MATSAMQLDGSKPSRKLPPSFQPGGGVVEGLVEIELENVRWRVLGYDDLGRLWCRSTTGGTCAWISR